jgi:hypothetical protein
MSDSKRSKNALSHGLYASDVVLAWENEQDFKDLHESLREDFGPEGASEEAAVFDMAHLHWRKRRLPGLQANAGRPARTLVPIPKK